MLLADPSMIASQPEEQLFFLKNEPANQGRDLALADSIVPNSLDSNRVIDRKQSEGD